MGLLTGVQLCGYYGLGMPNQVHRRYYDVFPDFPWRQYTCIIAVLICILGGSTHCYYYYIDVVKLASLR